MSSPYTWAWDEGLGTGNPCRTRPKMNSGFSNVHWIVILHGFSSVEQGSSATRITQGTGFHGKLSLGDTGTKSFTVCVWFFPRSSPCQRISRNPEESSQSQHTPHPRWPHESHILVSTFQEMPNDLRGHVSLHNCCVMWSHLSFFCMEARWGTMAQLICQN